MNYKKLEADLCIIRSGYTYFSHYKHYPALHTNNFHEYEISESYVLRTPMLPIGFSCGVLERIEETAFIAGLLEDSFIQKALFLASPDLFEALSTKSFKDNHLALKNRKLLYSLLKYLMRMGTRCTPFGLFAGIALGSFAKETRIIRETGTSHDSFLTVDASTYERLFDAVASETETMNCLKWFSNTTLFLNGNEIRWFEIEGDSSAGHEIEGDSSAGHFKLQTSARNKTLDSVLEKARGGILLKALMAMLTALGHSRQDSMSFLTALRESQVLKCGLAHNVFNCKRADVLLEIIPQKSRFYSEIKSLSQAFKTGDRDFGADQKGNNTDCANPTISSFINNVPKSSTMMDVFPRFEDNQLSLDVKGQILKALQSTSLFSPDTTNTDYFEFLKAYERRYGKNEMRLVDVLDTDYGLGYPIGHFRDGKDYISGFKLKKKLPPDQPNENLTDAELFLEKALSQLGKEAGTLELTDTDMASLRPAAHGFRGTFFGLVEFLEIDGKAYIHPISFGGASATVLHSRFGFAKDGVRSWLEHIADMEEGLGVEAIHAEVAFCPPGKVGNIAKRPVFRNYVIPYHNGMDLGTASPIHVDDLLLRPRNGNVELWSKTMDKRIIPYLSTAFNHHRKTPPLYRFLGDLQFSGKRPYYYFSWGKLHKMNIRFPRVVFGDCLLSKARWRFRVKDIKDLAFNKNDGTKFMNFTGEWVKENRLPRYIELVEDDNTLLIDTQNRLSLEMLFSTVRHKEEFLVQEHIPQNRKLVRNLNNGTFANQFQFTFQRNDSHGQT